MGILSAVLLDLLQEQFRHETANSLRYIARSSYARYRGLEATADFFSREAEGEQEHARVVRSWIEDRNCAVIPEPLTYTDSSSFSSYTDLFVSALLVERGTTERLNTLYFTALGECDGMLAIAVQKLLAEQTEEENLYQTILDRIKARGSDAATDHDIDIWIGERFLK